MTVDMGIVAQSETQGDRWGHRATLRHNRKGDRVGNIGFGYRLAATGSFSNRTRE